MTTHPFSPAGRQQALARMGSEEFDLLVVGGGISGCGVARDAALRGLKVAQVERADFGCGTSSRSSKLVHGGIRYLAHGEFRLVREAAQERRVLRQIAPHLVHPVPFLFPLYGGGATFRFGFWLFDRLAGASPSERHRRLGRAEMEERAPHLRAGVASGLELQENLTDDGRLTMENALCAALHGAAVANYTPLTRFLVRAGRVVGGRVRDSLTGQEIDVQAKVVVNATGPWAEQILRTGQTPPLKQIRPSKGIHILFRASRLPLTGAVYLRAPSGREGFAIRRWEYVYVGTSDVVHTGSLEGVVADRAAVLDLLALVQACFPGAQLTEADILATWAGLRPLIAEPGRAPRDTSRHDEVWQSEPGLLTLAGGKLTTYRPMARRIMGYVAGQLGRDLRGEERTAVVPLPGGELAGGYAQYEPFAAAMAVRLQERGVSPEAARRIIWLYGSRANELLRFGEQDSAWLEPLAAGLPALRGEVRLAVEQEMAVRLSDFMDRRAALLLFSAEHGLAGVERAAELMATMLGWSPEQKAAQVAAYRETALAHGLPPSTFPQNTHRKSDAIRKESAPGDANHPFKPKD